MEIKLRLITTYFLSLAIVLCVTAVGKITTVLQNPKLIWETDSTLDLPKGVVLLGACVLEICVSIFLLFSKSARMKASLVLWLSTIFFAYRVARWLGNEDVPCSCTGALEVIVPGGPATADRAAIWVLGYMVAGSALLLGSHIWAIAAQQAPKTVRRCIRGSVAFILVLILLPPIEVGCAAISTPRTMSLMLRKVVLKKSERQRGAWQSVSWTGIENVSPYFLHAALVGEDRKFFYHNGFDWQSIKAAIYESVRRRRPPHGASTITQQCARSLFLWQGRSWIRKGLEAYYTVWMELLLSKRRILELYVNVIELGEGIYGIEAAAQHYYGKAAKDLSREEAAMLAAILPAPKRWNPLQPNELVKQRQQLILSHIGEVRLPWEPPMKTAQPAAQPTPQ